MDKTCQNCQWAKEYKLAGPLPGPTRFHCHLNPPSVVLSNLGVTSEYPIVGALDYCSHFSAYRVSRSRKKPK